MFGVSAWIKETASLVRTVANTERTSVMITGETGTGKELIANAIHGLSNRASRPFVKLNCSAIPGTLLESEMFGYVKGAFTDARQDKLGLFELADTGTIFLDEIGDMDLSLQPKLLHVLERRAFRRIGGVRETPVDVRVIAATNKDLEAMAREGRFREDLLHRLKVIVINVLPLRERKEDILPLAGHFIEEYARMTGTAEKVLSKEAKDMLIAYPWPGNVRELRNVIERVMVLTSPAEILPGHLPQELSKAADHGPKARPFPMSGSKDMTIDELELDYIRHVLNKVKGNKTKASEILGISRLTLREKLKRMYPKGS
jgi:two-component system response regulator AtoC